MRTARGLTVKFSSRGQTYTAKDFQKMPDNTLLNKVIVFSESLPWKDEANHQDALTMLNLASGCIEDRMQGQNQTGKEKAEKTVQDDDRQRILTAILAEQAFLDAEKAVEVANRETEKTHVHMVSGKDLKGLRELNRIFKDLKGSFKRPRAAFINVRNFLRGTIDDVVSGRMVKSSKQNAPDRASSKIQDQGQEAKAGTPAQG